MKPVCIKQFLYVLFIIILCYSFFNICKLFIIEFLNIKCLSTNYFNNIGRSKFIPKWNNCFLKQFAYNMLIFICGKRDSNPQPLTWQANTLPLSYFRCYKLLGITKNK